MTAAYRLWRERDGSAPFTVVSMFTPSHRPLAERLAASLDRTTLPYALYEVPSVHRSISAQGGGDIAFSKPRVIAWTLRNGPVLHVDTDVIFRAPPTAIPPEADFAIYNWLADPGNDAWAPVRATPDEAPRFWKFFFAFDAQSDSQLAASGAVQFWSPAAAPLLAAWEDAIAAHPGVQDDHCLDFAFNITAPAPLRTAWLPKDHCRYGFWPYVKPVIDHPDFPAPASGPERELGLARFDRSKLRPRQSSPPIPRDGVIDTYQSVLQQGGRTIPLALFPPTGNLTSKP